MLVKIYDARQSIYEKERPPEGKREFVVEVKDISVNVEKLVINEETVAVGEKDLLLIDASRVLFVNVGFDSERGITVYKEAHIYTRAFSLKEAIRDGLEEAQWIVTWVVRPPE